MLSVRCVPQGRPAPIGQVRVDAPLQLRLHPRHVSAARGLVQEGHRAAEAGAGRPGGGDATQQQLQREAITHLLTLRLVLPPPTAVGRPRPPRAHDTRSGAPQRWPTPGPSR
jgi:hypothetical protein